MSVHEHHLHLRLSKEANMNDSHSACGAALLVLLSLSLYACTQPKSTEDPFMNQWRELADTAQGYSPATEDLRPEPRVLMRYQEPQNAPPKALPSLPVTLKLHNVDVGVALRSLAAAAEVNILLGSGISGTVSINVRKAPWKDVFLGLLTTSSLQYRWQGTLLQISTLAEKKREVELLTLDNQLAQQRLLSSQNRPLSLSVIKIRYADAQTLQQSLAGLFTTSGSPNGQSTTITVDEHSNSLIIQATETDQRRLLSLVEGLDQPRPQVQLKAYIVEATKESARELGTQWGGIWRSAALRGGNRMWAGSGGAAGKTGSDPINTPLDSAGNAGLGGTPFGFDYTPGGTGKMGSLGLMFGKVGGNILEIQLNLLQKEGQISILSAPSITTLDNKMAYTENGQKVPYVSTSTMGDREVRFESATLRLEMTPNVIDNDNLKLKIMVRKDEVDTSRTVDGNPFIIKKQTETTLIMRNDETVVISGLTKEKGSIVTAGIPGLKDLPGGNVVFGHESKNAVMEEVLIFITPRILPIRYAPEAASPGDPPASTGAQALPAPDPALADRRLEDLTESDLNHLGLKE